jgi:5-methylthioadenosine/S-adenosylhomocysteine deaminase
LTPKFVNAHSHLEYFDLMHEIEETEFWPWLSSLTSRKCTRDLQAVERSILKAASHNVRTGVWAIAEWSDWHGSDSAMSELGLEGVIFQEVITIREWNSPSEKLEAVRAKSAQNALPTFETPHAPYTVTPAVIAALAATGDPLSIHVAESAEENDFYQRGGGPIADAYAAAGIEFDVPGMTAVGYLETLGTLHSETQLVHLCAATEEDIQIISRHGCSVAHCPRSNVALSCPVPEIGMMLDCGIRVGLGLDSAASSGPIDMFAEMRAAIALSERARRPLTHCEVWTMATRTDAVPGLRVNEIAEGASPQVMLIESAADFGALVSCSAEHILPGESNS